MKVCMECGKTEGTGHEPSHGLCEKCKKVYFERQMAKLKRR